MDGSYFEVNINNHVKSNLLLGDEIEKSDGEIEKNERKVSSALPTLPMCVPLLLLDDDVVRSTAVSMVTSLFCEGQAIGMVSFVGALSKCIANILY